MTEKRNGYKVIEKFHKMIHAEEKIVHLTVAKRPKCIIMYNEAIFFGINV